MIAAAGLSVDYGIDFEQPTTGKIHHGKIHSVQTLVEPRSKPAFVVWFCHFLPDISPHVVVFETKMSARVKCVKCQEFFGYASH